VLIIENYTEGGSPYMTVTLTTCTKFNSLTQALIKWSILIIAFSSIWLYHWLGRNNGMARFANKSNINFPLQECGFEGKQLLPLTTFSWPGENRLDKQTPSKPLGGN
jgi:hypothetical protein